MIDRKFKVRVLRNTPANMAALVKIGERHASDEWHILRNDKNLALVTHYAWDTCEYCEADTGPNGIIDMTKDAG